MLALGRWLTLHNIHRVTSENDMNISVSVNSALQGKCSMIKHRDQSGGTEKKSDILLAHISSAAATEDGERPADDGHDHGDEEA